MANSTRGDVQVYRNLTFGAAGAAGTANQVAISNGPGLGNAYVDVTSLFTLVSADANNDITAGTDGGAFLQETVTSLTYNAGTTTLSFTDEDGAVSNIDLSALTTDIYVDGATFNAATTTLTLTDNDGTTPDVTVDLSTLRSVLTDNGDGTYTHNDGNGTNVTINARQGVSTDANNSLTNGTDNRPFFDETVTAISGLSAGALAGTIRYTDEDGANTDLTLVSADAGNDLGLGTDGKLLLVETVTDISGMSAGALAGTIRHTDEDGANTDITLISTDAGNGITTGADGKLFATAGSVEIEFAVADWSALGATTAGLYDLTISAATISAAGGNPGAAAQITVMEGAAGADKEEVGVHTERVLNADGSVFLQVPGTLTDDRFDGSIRYTSV